MEKPFRIAFLQCHKSTRTRNGINTFVENFLAMCDSLGIYVDVIMDRNDKIVFDYENLKTVNVIFPDFEYPDDKEQQLSGMFRYPISFSKILNCRMSLVNQMKKSVYDMVFINSEELIPVVAYTGIKLPVFVYSHTRGVWLEFSKNKTIFKDLYDMVDSQKDRMTMLTQTDFNVERFKNMYDYSDVRRVRMPMPSNIFHLQDVEKDGVIFIGRLSSSKRFEDYCKLIQMTGKKALIMTPSDLSQVKNVLDEYEITNYEIGQGLVGHARNVFMNRAEYCFHPAEDESFGFAPAEMSKLTTTFVLSCYDQTKEIIKLGATGAASIEEVAKLIGEGFVDSTREERYNEFCDGIVEEWEKVFNSLPNTQSRSSSIRDYFAKHGPFQLAKFYEDLGRSTYSDFDSYGRQILTNVPYIQSREGTYIGTELPSTEVSGGLMSLFGT